MSSVVKGIEKAVTSVVDKVEHVAKGIVSEVGEGMQAFGCLAKGDFKGALGHVEGCAKTALDTGMSLMTPTMPPGLSMMSQSPGMQMFMQSPGMQMFQGSPAGQAFAQSPASQLLAGLGGDESADAGFSNPAATSSPPMGGGSQFGAQQLMQAQQANMFAMQSPMSNYGQQPPMQAQQWAPPQQAGNMVASSAVGGNMPRDIFASESAGQHKGNMEQFAKGDFNMLSLTPEAMASPFGQRMQEQFGKDLAEWNKGVTPQ